MQGIENELGQQQRLTLAKLYVASVEESIPESAREGTGKPLPMVDSETLSRLEKEGYVGKAGNRFELTTKGRKSITVVMAGGAFDILHPGHIQTLEAAKKLGDVLVVSVARNSTYERNKGKRPLHDEKLRRDLVGCVRFVDLAVLGSEKDIFETVEWLKPDIIALGYDQAHSESAILGELERRNIKVKVVRLDSSVPEIKTSRIITERRDLFLSSDG